ncbi:hypothetical protein WISP_132879 [Willisornis vidua]|uniref:Uncharacterized protein n=1 Tax=Willisornis vidua TaxID=1566151 RepID=A0ABQ9CU66_9PASS|nr:hypothetical protein WISP_132879 [Willisornis vidua]
MRSLFCPSSWITSGLGAKEPTCADLKKSSFCPCHTAFSDSSVNMRLESDTQTGGSSGGGPSLALAASSAVGIVSIFFLMHRKSRSQSITAVSRKRGKRRMQAAAWVSSCKV